MFYFEQQRLKASLRVKSINSQTNIVIATVSIVLKKLR